MSADLPAGGHPAGSSPAGSAPAGSASEFSRIIDVRYINAAPLVLEPDETERRRLAGRFGISGIDAMRAELRLEREPEAVTVTGRLTAAIVQACAISGEDFAVAIDEPVALRFVPDTGEAPVAPDEEIELTATACDEIPYSGPGFDLGEAIAQTLALAIDPFAEGPEADRARREYGLDGSGGGGAFAALAALKTKD
ncbi:YceD family protein [Novosphingobium sp.]|uniref:YceD family protein n=1 Tax=Novosphingobium sp. TaxID=1874826 RepID=UPI0038BAC86A